MNQELIDNLEEMLRRARTGELIAGVMILIDGEGYSICKLAGGGNTMRMIGAMEVLKYETIIRMEMVDDRPTIGVVK